MVTLRMRLECSVLRAGQTQPDQVYQVGGLGRDGQPRARVWV